MALKTCVLVYIMATTTIIGYGSLLSETSARSTFGHHVKNFRLGRVHNYRRVFAHPASIFFQRGIAIKETLEMASLSAEVSPGTSFAVSAFDIPTSQLPDFYDREEEFSIEEVEFHDPKYGRVSKGLMCCRWNDADYIAKRGQSTFDKLYRTYGLDTIWGYDASSGILPCRVYLRHCILAVQKLGEDIYDDFVQNTYLGDRTTTIQSYLAENPTIMDAVPPAHLVGRYSG